MATKRPLVVSSNGEPQVIKPGDVIEVNAGGTGVSTLPDLKTALNLNNVENKNSATIRGELTSQDVITALGYTPSAGAGGGITYVNVDIDFGSVSKQTVTVDVSNASALTTKRVLCQTLPDSDEYEMDLITAQGYCPVDGTVRLIVSANPGPVTGIRKICYWLG